jgi:hypothetical protein
MDQDAVSQRLRKLTEQHDAGHITDAEYAAGKRALLGGWSPTDAPEETLVLNLADPTPPPPPAGARGGLLWLIAAAGLVILVLVAVVLIGPSLR